MRDKNEVKLSGRLGAEVDFKSQQNGASIANLSVATNEYWYDQKGDRQERTEWHRVVCFTSLAETAQKSLKKGSEIVLEGKLRTTKWQDKDGIDRYTTEIICNWFKPCLSIQKEQINEDLQNKQNNMQNNTGQNLGGYNNMPNNANSTFDEINFD